MKIINKTLPIMTMMSLLVSCNLPARPTSNPGIDQSLAGTIVAMTLESLVTKQVSGSSTPTAALPAPNTPQPEFTATIPISPTVTLTTTQTTTITPTFSAPMLSFEGNTNCREGPGTDYKVVIVLKKGQKIEPVGAHGNYWVVKVPNQNTTCWVAADYATPGGSTWTLPTVTTPLPPTRTPPLAPTWSKWNYTCSYAVGGSNLLMELIWTDQAFDESGYRVYRNGEVIITLAAGVNTYTDNYVVETGKNVDYNVEAYNDAGASKSSTITVSCQ